MNSYQVTIGSDKKKKKDTFSEAQIELDVEGRKIISKGSGNGPINALDKALRKDLGLYNEYLKDLVLVDYKVRILDGGTEAITRVVIESSDKDIDSWFTVGVNPNIVEASFQALMDSINYKLIKEGAPIKKSD